MGGQHQRQRGAGVIRSPLTMLSVEIDTPTWATAL